MTWARPEMLALLWGIPLVVGLLAWAGRRRSRALRLLVSAGVLGRLVPRGLGAVRFAQGTAWVLALALGILALAQPRVGFEWRELEKKGIDVAILLDVSLSMDARDVSPSRMERATREVEDLLSALPSDRVGLVVFAGGAYPRIPLTLDHDAVRFVMRDIGTSTLRAQGTSLAAAIDTGMQLLDQPQPSERALILISDGETDDREGALAAATRAGEAGVRIFAMGVGTEDGAPIPLEEGGFKKDRSGEVVVSRLGSDVLRALASATGGAYVNSVASAEDVSALVNDQIHAKLEAGLLGMRREKVWNERFQWPLVGAILLVVGAVLLAPRQGAAAVFLLVGLAGAAQAGEASGTGMTQARPEETLQELTNAHLDDPDDMSLAFRLGEALYRAGRYNEAEGIWENVAERSADPGLRSQARYNMGNAAYFAGRLTDAQRHYQRALEQVQGWKAAEENATEVGREIAARMKQDPPSSSPSQCNNPSQDGGDQEPQEGAPTANDEEPEGKQSPPQAEQGATEERDHGADDGTRQAPRDAEAGAEQAGVPEGQAGSPDAGQAPQDMAGQVQAGPGSPMSEEQALRLLDTVDEGSPRVVIGGESQRTQDW